MSALPDDVRAIFERFELDLPEDPPDLLVEEGPLVPRDKLLGLARALKLEAHCLFFVYCAAAHYPPGPASRIPGMGEGELPDGTLVAYRVRRLAGGRPVDVPFRVWVPTGETTPSLVPVWVGADWQEREQYDLVGTVFEGHPDLRRIMLPEDWEGHPLRKDYAIDTPHFPWR